MIWNVWLSDQLQRLVILIYLSLFSQPSSFQSVCPYVCLSGCLFVCLSICLAVCLYLHPSSVHLSSILSSSIFQSIHPDIPINSFIHSLQYFWNVIRNNNWMLSPYFLIIINVILSNLFFHCKKTFSFQNIVDYM